MNRTICSAVLFAAVASIGLNAQTINLRANVPFGFHVGTNTLPPGDYVVSHEPQTTLIFIKDSRGHMMAQPLFTTGESLVNPPATAVLVFNRYGSEYFLSKVRSAGAGQGRLLPKSRAEDRVAKATRADNAVTASISAK